jgi:alpha-mannosidase
LNGTQTFRFACYPHDGDWRAAGVPDVAMSLLRPPVAAVRVCPADAKPMSKTLLAIDGNLIPTSVHADGNRLVCRVYEPYGKKPEYSFEYLGKPVAPRLCDVADKPVESLRAWEIANLMLATPPAGPDK